VLGDKSYDSKPLHEEFDKKCIKFYALVRKNERNTPEGHFRKKCRELDNNYNRRNTVESVFHTLKWRFLLCLRGRLHYAKKREMAWTVI